MRADWEMNTPVLSTAHILPATLKHLEGVAGNAKYPSGIFVFVGFDHPDVWDAFPDMKAIMVWLRENYGENETWIRFDCDAEVMEELCDYSPDWDSASSAMPVAMVG
jgi:hypothetical protein